MKNHKKIFWFMAFHATFWMGHNYCILGLIKYIDLSAYHGTRYLVLLGGEKYDFIYNRIRYHIVVKINIA